MILTWKIVIRIALLILLGAILQLAFFGQLTLLGAAPELLPVLIVSLGLLGGAVVGAVCGFIAGLLVDSLLLETLGVSSLVLLTVGYLAGRWREGFEITSSLVPPLLAAGLTLLAATEFAILQLLLGVEATVSLLVAREIVVKALLAFLLAFPVFPLVRRVLRPALVDEPARRRRAFQRATPRRAPSSPRLVSPRSL
jgi:rod shape-determining protein MreD